MSSLQREQSGSADIGAVVHQVLMRDPLAALGVIVPASGLLHKVWQAEIELSGYCILGPCKFHWICTSYRTGRYAI